MPVRVTYIMPREDMGNGQLGRCRIEDQMPRVARGRATDNAWRNLEWVDPEHQFNRERCEISFVLPAGFTAHIDDLGPCDDYEDILAKNPDWRPWTTYLKITAGGKDFVWQGVKVPALFKRARSGDSCTFEFGGLARAGVK